MKGNQLFRKIPPLDLVENILKIYGMNGLDVNYYFTLAELENKDVMIKIEKYIIELEKYYLRCKIKKYLRNLTLKRLVTILRQIIRPYKYRVASFEKYSNGKKYLLYKLEPDIPLKPADYGLIMDFD